MAAAPQVVFQGALHFQGEAALVAEVVRDRHYPDGGVEEGQVQRIDLRTAVVVGMCEGVSAGFRVCLSVPVVRFTCEVALGGVDRVVDRELQRDGAVAALHREEMEHEGGCFRRIRAENGIVPRVGQFFAAENEVLFRGCAVVDGKVQRIDLRTAVHIRVGISVIT